MSILPKHLRSSLATVLPWQHWNGEPPPPLHSTPLEIYQSLFFFLSFSPLSFCLGITFSYQRSLHCFHRKHQITAASLTLKKTQNNVCFLELFWEKAPQVLHVFLGVFLWTLLWAKSEPKLSTVSNDTPNNISWTQILDNVWVGFLSVHFISNYCSQMFIHLILSFTSLGHSLSLSWFWAFLPLRLLCIS